jgi:hypothetical protein
MKKLSQLVTDLEKLNKDFLEKTKWNLQQTRECIEQNEKEQQEAGQLLINFYNNTFVPQYSESSEIPKDIFEEVDSHLCYFSSKASKFVKEKNYFGLNLLLIPKGSSIGDPNILEELIKKLKGIK